GPRECTAARWGRGAPRGLEQGFATRPDARDDELVRPPVPKHIGPRRRPRERDPGPDERPRQWERSDERPGQRRRPHEWAREWRRPDERPHERPHERRPAA